jgi:hypothetical protein
MRDQTKINCSIDILSTRQVVSLIPVSGGDSVFESDADDITANVLDDVKLGGLHLRNVFVGNLFQI